MSDSNNTRSSDEQLAELAAAFDRDTDPLATYGETFETAGIDPLQLFLTDVLEPRGLSSGTMRNYRTAFRQWREYMRDQGRHPACPNVGHVKGFVRYLRAEHDNHPRTVKMKLRHLNSAYEYWQDEPAFPHPTDFNPFSAARQKVNLDTPQSKEPPRISVERLRKILGEVTHVRDRAIITMQLKLGLRRGELCNIKLEEVNLSNSELRDHYPELGAHSMVEGRKEIILIPSRESRDGNKSHRPRVLPLDDELRHVLLQYLLIRPDSGSPWLFLTHTNQRKLDDQAVRRAWNEYFRPEYDETERHAAVSSHYGRHRFTTYWMVEQDASRELVKYMRGDIAGAAPAEGQAGIDHYIHTYYEDIEQLYRENIFRLGV